MGVRGFGVVLEKFIPGMGPGKIIEPPLLGGEVADVDGSQKFK